MEWRQVDSSAGAKIIRTWGCGVTFLWWLLRTLAVLLLSLLLIKWLWAWTVPELFPGAVREGLVAREIEWVTSFKLAIFIAVVATVTGIRRRGQ